MNNRQKLRACGIIAEYNPFHNGHIYHLKQTKKEMVCDVVVCIMSGNWVQRGEYAIIDKWTRAQAALESGADIVVELPSAFAVQAADYFGLGAMKVAKQLELSQLAFGMEHTKVLTAIQTKPAQAVDNKQKDFTQSHAKRFANSVTQLPNQLLAYAYVKGMKQMRHEMSLLPIRRLEAQHAEKQLLLNRSIASATAIRLAVANKEKINPFVPKGIARALQNAPKQNDLFWQLLKYRVMQSTEADLRTIYQMCEGIEYVLKREVNQAENYDDFLNRVQNKRFTKKRLQRLCVYIVLNWTTDTIQQIFEKEQVPLRVLGFSPKGRRYLKQLDHTTHTMQLKKENIKAFEMIIRADKVYEQLTGVSEQNFKRVVRVNEEYKTL